MKTPFKSGKEQSFKEGMEAGARPCEEKFNKQANDIESIGKQFKTSIEEAVLPTMNQILDFMDTKEKEELLGLLSLNNINSLEDDYKITLINILYQLFRDELAPSLHQKSYIKTIQCYLNIPLLNVQDFYDTSKIENIDSIHVQKSILKATMELLFLKDLNFNFLEIHKDLFIHFNVKEAEYHIIQNRINYLYKIGPEVIVAQYGYSDESPSSDLKTDEKTDTTMPDESTSLDYNELIQQCLTNSIESIRTLDAKAYVGESLSKAPKCMYQMYTNANVPINKDDIIGFISDDSAYTSILFTVDGIVIENQSSKYVFFKYTDIDHITSEHHRIIKSQSIIFYGNFSNGIGSPQKMQNGMFGLFYIQDHFLDKFVQLAKQIKNCNGNDLEKDLQLKLQLLSIAPLYAIDQLLVEKWDDDEIILTCKNLAILKHLSPHILSSLNAAKCSQDGEWVSDLLDGTLRLYVK